MSTYRLVNYPQSIEACHDLIRCLTAELNAINSLPSTTVKKFQPPAAGLNGGSQGDWGVTLGFSGVGGVPSTHDSVIRGSSNDCPF